jgi:5S rRNA maturation endonuclease (ribonuclease M5)
MNDDVVKVLTDNGVFFKTNPNNPVEILIQCFSGMHEDKNPSLGFNLEKGVYHCFSCGVSGNADKLFRNLGIYNPITATTKQTYKINKLIKKLDKIRFGTNVRLPEPRDAINYDFKGISSETLVDFEAFTTTADGLENYICIPVYQFGKLRFIESRYSSLVEKLTVPKYLRKPGGVEVSDVLFPLDNIENFDTIILVEGIFDMLNLYDLGYTNTLCYFGVENFNAQKAKLLDEYGCKHVIVVADGDAPGRRVAKKIEQLFDNRSIKTTIVELDDGKDPGSLTFVEAKQLLKPLIGD